MEAIRQWLNGKRLYSTGVLLYTQYGKDTLLKKLFCEAETNYKKDRLITALQDLLSNKKETDEITVSSKEVQLKKLQAEKTIGIGWSDKMDAVEKALYEQWKPKFLEMMDLISQLYPVAKEGVTDPWKREQAGKMALRILDLDDECDDYYSQRDYYLKNKRLPEEKPYGDICLDPQLMPLKLQNHKRYAREFRNKLKNEPGNVKAAEKLKEHEWFISKYEEELKMHK